MTKTKISIQFHYFFEKRGERTDERTEGANDIDSTHFIN